MDDASEAAFARLGLARKSATRETIKAAFARHAFGAHPDSPGGSAARFQQLVEDRDAALAQIEACDAPEDKVATTSQTYRLTVTISEQQAIDGCSIILNSNGPCNTCLGTGSIDSATPRVCKECSGTGVVLVADQGSVPFACDGCDGKGFYFRSYCADCDGHGWSNDGKSGVVVIPANARIDYPVILQSAKGDRIYISVNIG